MKCHNEKGFTLVEIMIVVAIIGLLAAISIPNLLRARMSSNDGAIQDDLRAASTAIEGFRSDQNPPGYPANFAALTGAVPPYLDTTWTDAGPTKHGHTVTGQWVGGAGAATYAVEAIAVANAANNSYCIDQTGVIGVKVGGAATAAATGCDASYTPVTG